MPKEAIVKNDDKYFIFIQEKAHNEKEEKNAEAEKEHTKTHFKAIEIIPETIYLGYIKSNL